MKFENYKRDLAEKIKKETEDALRKAGITPRTGNMRHSVVSVYSNPKISKINTAPASEGRLHRADVRALANNEPTAIGRGLVLNNKPVEEEVPVIDSVIDFTLPDGKSFCEFVDPKNYRFYPMKLVARGAASKVNELTIGTTKYLVRETKYKDILSSSEKFRLECEILNSLRDSPYVMTIYGACRIRDIGYMLLEYVPGRTMFEWLKEEGTKQEAERFRVYKHLLHGLATIHGRGYVHLDIKPANIWIPSDPARPPFFLDFDLAKPADIAVTSEILHSGTKEYQPVPEIHNLKQRNSWALGRVIGEYNNISHPSGISGSNMEVKKHKTPEMGTLVGIAVKSLQETKKNQTNANFGLLADSFISDSARVGGGGASGGAGSSRRTRRARRNKKLTRRHRRA